MCIRDRGSGKPIAWKWLDLGALSQALAPHDQLGDVRYFTAHVTATGNAPGPRIRQQTYLRALATLPQLSVYLGQFQREKKRMPIVANPTPTELAVINQNGLDVRLHPDGFHTIKVIRTEEKGSDVNLATWLLYDAFHGACDKALVFSNDTDLCEPIRLVIAEFGIDVVVVNPRGHLQPAVQLRKVATDTRSVRISAVQAAQFPVTLTDANGTFSRPMEWS